MNLLTEKIQKKNNLPASISVAEKRSVSKTSFQLVDNRPHYNSSQPAQLSTTLNQPLQTSPISHASAPVQMARDNLKDKMKANPIGYGLGFGAITGGIIGAAIGTIVAPGIGTAIGAAIGTGGGALIGGIAGGIWNRFRRGTNQGNISETSPLLNPSVKDSSGLMEEGRLLRLSQDKQGSASTFSNAEEKFPSSLIDSSSHKKEKNRLSPVLSRRNQSSTLIPIGPGHSSTNVRRAKWGGIVEAAPGVGIEIIDPDYKGDLLEHPYVRFIQHQLMLIQSTKIGTSLIEQFGEHGGFKAREIDSSSENNKVYKGIKVIIGKPYKMPKNRVIETSEQTGIKEANNNFSPNPRDGTGIPRINFFGPAERGEETPIGTSGAVVTGSGIERHKDFPDDIQPFDIVLAHEFVHAYLSQSGIFNRLIKRDYPEKVDMIKKISGTTKETGLSTKLSQQYSDLPPTLEEILVVGIENRYRSERQQRARQSYHSVHIPANPLAPVPWEFSLDPKEIIKALLIIGMTEKNAFFVVTGKE